MAFVYQDQENHVTNLRKLRSNVAVVNEKTQIQKRSVLGLITTKADNAKAGPSKYRKVNVLYDT